LSHSSNVSVPMATRIGRSINCAGSLILLKSDDGQDVIVSLDATGSVINSTRISMVLTVTIRSR
jgi:hypothetical protein